MQPLISKCDSRFLPVGLFFICLVSVGLVFHDTVAGLVSRWLLFDESYGHGFLVVVCSLYLTGRALYQRGMVVSSPSWYLALLLLVLSLFMAMADAVRVDLLPQVLLPIMAWLAFALVAGIGTARRIIVPWGLVYFAIPVWDYLNNGLVTITSEVVGILISRSGITAYITGNSIFIPSGEVVIAAGCSGLRYLVIGTFLGVLGSYLNFISYRREALLLLAIVFLSLLANWVRVYGITMLAYLSEMQSPLIHDHELAGWVVFMVFITPLLYVGARTGRAAFVANTDTGSAGLTARPARAGHTMIALLTVCLVILVGPLWLGGSVSGDMKSIGINDIAGMPVPGWDVRTHTPAANDWRPRIVPPTHADIEQYDRSGNTVLVYRNLYTKTDSQDEILPYIGDLYDRDN